ncbi:hypothetical protein Q3V37_06380 [Micromonospora profundi]|uniref:Uncharacterized protein n=1 Tax=Micromonospora profundi TaxID=1420889 RepID=A0AAJ6HTE6_9ACTN|nr:hypothetical protein [Micromonospora profundi]WLS46880.1 hypothetical protein Q3V37_06380 [Micromonospora profundi]
MSLAPDVVEGREAGAVGATVREAGTVGVAVRVGGPAGGVHGGVPAGTL